MFAVLVKPLELFSKIELIHFHSRSHTLPKARASRIASHINIRMSLQIKNPYEINAMGIIEVLTS